MARNDALNNEQLLPETLRNEFHRVQRELETDREFGHVFNTDRVRLWRAMDEHYGYHGSAMRRAVLAARVVWPLLPMWEDATLETPGMLPSPDCSGMPRLYLKSCTKALLQKPCDLDQKSRDRIMAKMERLVIPEFEPLCLVILAILEADSLIAGARYCDDDELGEEIEQIWNGVETGELDELGDRDDWDLLDCHFWASETIAGDLRDRRKNDRTARKDFWIHWLDDFVVVNTLAIDELVADLARFID